MLKPQLTSRLTARLHLRFSSAIAIALGANLAVHTSTTAATSSDLDETVHVAPFQLPQSSLLDDQTRKALLEFRRQQDEWVKSHKSSIDACNGAHNVTAKSNEATMECLFGLIYETPFYKSLRARFPVVITNNVIGGVPVEIFVPADGISRANKNRVLINLHGGHFLFGSKTISRLESIPVAALGKIKVISIDYRYAPKFKFPAASQDVERVYRVLLGKLPPRNIGVFGCSAGGLLTAESIAWFEKDNLPLPAAIVMSSSGAAYYQEGDSIHFAAAVEGDNLDLEPPAVHPYFGPATVSDPMAFPILSNAILARFPPTLLISSTRDLALSSAVRTHEILTALGRPTELHVWEGLGHCFFNSLPIPQSDDANRLIYEFFDKHLGK